MESKNSRCDCDDAIKSFKEATAKPVDYLGTDNRLSNTLKKDLKRLYEFSVSNIKSENSSALPTLIVNNLDLEQIWQQLELKNGELLTTSVNDIPMLVAQKNQLVFQHKQQESSASESEDERDEEVDDTENKSESEESITIQEFSDASSNNEERDLPNTDVKKKSVVDDDFFKLSEMENFLKLEEKKMSNPDENDSESDEDDDEEGSIDMFDGQKEEDEDEANAKTARFKDYFVRKDEEKKTKRKRFLSESEDEEGENSEMEKNVKSSVELRQERLKQKIEEIEEQAVGEKPWQLKGEITAESRPQNSLLEEIVEFDLTSRPAPVITEQTSLQLEDIIRQRIKDKVFDSVERKMKPVETPLEFKKKLVLDQEKSKQSLAQIYEKEYLEQQATLDPEHTEKEEEPELHKEVEQLMKSLFSKLDALSNFYFTSKPAVPELKVISNLPAISMEEVAPVAMSGAALLAPEEIRNKPHGNIIGKSERTSTDKKRERRKKKLKQKTHAKIKLEKEKLRKINDGVPKKYGIKRKKA